MEAVAGRGRVEGDALAVSRARFYGSCAGWDNAGTCGKDASEGRRCKASVAGCCALQVERERAMRRSSGGE